MNCQFVRRRSGGTWIEAWPGVVIKLTSQTGLTGQNFVNRRVTLARDGTLYLSTFSNVMGASFSDEWVQTGRSATVGDAFEASFDNGPWFVINTNLYSERYAGGTINVRIRALGGGATILANANFTFN